MNHLDRIHRLTRIYYDTTTFLRDMHGQSPSVLEVLLVLEYTTGEKVTSLADITPEILASLKEPDSGYQL